MENKLERAIEATACTSPRWLVTAGVIGGMTIMSNPTSADVQIPLAMEMKKVGSDSLSAFGTGNLTSATRDYESYLAGWHADLPTSDWYFELSSRLDNLSSKPDGWKGSDSHSANPDALKYARALLWKLAQEGVDRRPSIGLDHEGTFSFMWLDPEVKADLTVYDDGTYSFFAKSAVQAASVDDARVGEPLDSRLLSALLS